MSFTIKLLRSLIAGATPPNDIAKEGVPYINIPDKRIGFINDSGDAENLVAVTFHSDRAAYVVNNLVKEAGIIYRCVNPHTAKVFDPNDWVSTAVNVGTALAFNYRWDNSTGGNPATGHVSVSQNYPLPVPPTTFIFYAHKVTDGEGDVSVFWDALRVGDYLFFQESSGNLESVGMAITAVNGIVGDVYSFTGVNIGSSATEPENNTAGVVSLLENPASRVPEGGLPDEALTKLTTGQYDMVWKAPFTPRLAGYLDTGLHLIYTADLNDIANDSKYQFNAAIVTNNPSDMPDGRGFVMTMMRNVDNGTQVIYGENGSNVWKTWMRQKATTWGAWKLVVDGGAFTERLAGYADTGLHTAWAADANDVLNNSAYIVFIGGTTNLPSDFTTNGVMFTDMVDSSTDAAVQRIVGMQGLDVYKQWQRSREGGVWGAWKLMVDGGAFTERLAGYLDTGWHTQYSGDLNDITVNSTFNVLGSNVTNEPADFQTGSWGYITSYVHSAVGWVTQMLYGMNGTNTRKVWMRESEGGVWAAWKLVVDGNALSFSAGKGTFTDVVRGVEPVDNADLTTKEYVDSELAGLAGNPTGVILDYVSIVPPSGYLLCDGSAIPAEYVNLIALVGPNTPDLRGQFIRGWSNTAGQDPSGPRAPLSSQNTVNIAHNHTATQGNHTHAANQPSHTHNANQANHTHTYVSGNKSGRGSTGSVGQLENTSTKTTSATAPAITVGSTTPAITVTAAAAGNISVGNSGSSESRPINIAMVKIIKHDGSALQNP